MWRHHCWTSPATSISHYGARATAVLAGKRRGGRGASHHGVAGVAGGRGRTRDGGRRRRGFGGVVAALRSPFSCVTGLDGGAVTR